MRDTIYRQCLVAFIDILGFRALINNLRPQQVEELRDTLKTAMLVGRIGADRNLDVARFYAKMFSDSVAMSVPTHRTTLFQFLLHIIHFQGALANRGVFVRGAVAVGDHFEDKEILFGPALIQAVDSERTLAIWPRIVVHPDVVELAREPPSPASLEQDERGLVKRLVRRDSDGICYLNYLRIYPDECDSPEQFLENHRNYIVESAKINRLNLAILAKYYWLATYHNSEVEARGRSDLRINMPTVFPRL